MKKIKILILCFFAFIATNVAMADSGQLRCEDIKYYSEREDEVKKSILYFFEADGFSDTRCPDIVRVIRSDLAKQGSTYSSSSNKLELRNFDEKVSSRKYGSNVNPSYFLVNKANSLITNKNDLPSTYTTAGSTQPTVVKVKASLLPSRDKKAELTLELKRTNNCFSGATNDINNCGGKDNLINLDAIVKQINGLEPGRWSVSFTVNVKNQITGQMEGVVELYIMVEVPGIPPAACFKIDGSSIRDYDGDNCPSRLIIPATINGKQIIRIDDGAFSGKGLKAVTISNGIKQIGLAAFQGAKLYQNNNVPYVKNQIERISLPSSIVSIESYAFASNYELTNVIIPEGVKSIGGSAFGSNNLKSIAIPFSVETIGNDAFGANFNLTSVTWDCARFGYSTSIRHIFYPKNPSLSCSQDIMNAYLLGTTNTNIHLGNLGMMNGHVVANVYYRLAPWITDSFIKYEALGQSWGASWNDNMTNNLRIAAKDKSGKSVLVDVYAWVDTQCNRYMIYTGMPCPYYEGLNFVLQFAPNQHLSPGVYTGTTDLFALNWYDGNSFKRNLRINISYEKK